MNSSSNIVKFSNPMCGTKFLLLQRLCNNEGQEENFDSLLPGPLVVNSEVSKVVPSISNAAATHPKSFIPNSRFKCKKIRQKGRKKKKRCIDSECYAPIPVISRENHQLSVIRESLPVSVSIPNTNISPLATDDSRVTGSVTQKVLGLQPKNDNQRRISSGNSSDRSVNLSISDESRARVTLTPLNHASNIERSKLEPEVITLSSDSSEKTDVSEPDSHNHSPSLLENALLTDEMTFDYMKEHNLVNNTANSHIYLTACEVCCKSLPNAKNVGLGQSDETKQTRAVSLNIVEKSRIDTSENKQTAQNNTSYQYTKNKYQIEDINKGSHKCLKLILSVLRSHFEISQFECFNILKKNDFNLITTLVELQTLHPEVR